MAKQLDVHELTRSCREETGRYLRGESFSEYACFELFRRAVVERDDAAWESVYAQYSSLARLWLNAGMDEDDGVNAAFERFWRAVDSDKFARFGSLAAVLSYLKMCVRTTVLDHIRAQSRSAVMIDLDAIPAVSAQAHGQGEVGDRLDAADMWRQVGELLKDERERRLVYLSYVLGLSPREIHARHGYEFPRMEDIYRIKRGALARLRRSAVFGGIISANFRDGD